MAEEKKTVKKATAKKPESEEKAKKAPKAEKPVDEKKAAKAAEKAAKAAAKEAKKAAKAKVEEKPKATQATAFARDVRITPRKVRLVADLVRGKDVKVALGILAGCNRVAKTPVEKIIRSAAANAVNNFGMDEHKLYIAEIQVGDGLKIKRYIPRAKGSASPIIKRNAHIRIVVKERN
ncbi:MAG: 50S ribosomal protein L22 [Bacilli bacterium]|nr:50S ribosomal protein L22 [Bacilli bacterium]